MLSQHLTKLCHLKRVNPTFCNVNFCCSLYIDLYVPKWLNKCTTIIQKVFRLITANEVHLFFTSFFSLCHPWSSRQRLYVLHASVHACMRASVCVCVCFLAISSICQLIFSKLLSMMHLGTTMNWVAFVVKRSKINVTYRGWIVQLDWCNFST